MAIQIKETDYENYGKCVHISNGTIEMMVTIDMGPCIIYLGFVGGRNVLYTDLARKHALGGEEFDLLYGKDKKFYFYGGHRLLLSPEDFPSTYYPDNEPVVYGILPDGVSFTPARQKHNEMQLGFEVMMNESDADIMIVHSAKNHAKETQTLALWALTMMAPGGLEIIPQNEGGENHLPNRSVILWPYTKINDPRVCWGDRFVTFRHDPEAEQPLKLGFNNLPGWAVYVNRGAALMKRFVHNIHAAYPDFGASYETYLNSDFLEMETLSPLYHIEPGESIRHVENLTLFRAEQAPNPKDEQQIQTFIDGLTN